MTSAPSIAHAFERTAEKYGSRVFLKEKRAQSWTDLSWTEIATASRRLRAGLLKLGLQTRRPGRNPGRKLPAMGDCRPGRAGNGRSGGATLPDQFRR